MLAAYTNAHFFCEDWILRSTRILFSFLRIPPFHTLAVLRAGQKKGKNHFLSHWARLDVLSSPPPPGPLAMKARPPPLPYDEKLKKRGEASATGNGVEILARLFRLSDRREGERERERVLSCGGRKWGVRSIVFLLLYSPLINSLPSKARKGGVGPRTINLEQTNELPSHYTHHATLSTTSPSLVWYTPASKTARGRK